MKEKNKRNEFRQVVHYVGSLYAGLQRDSKTKVIYLTDDNRSMSHFLFPIICECACYIGRNVQSPRSMTSRLNGVQ